MDLMDYEFERLVAEVEECLEEMERDLTPAPRPRVKLERPSGRTCSRERGFMEQLLEMMGMAQLQSAQYPKFAGDAREYIRFTQTFEVLASKLPDDSARLTALIQRCEGEAKWMIEDCVLLPPRKGYQRAVDLLKMRYGQKHFAHFIEERAWCASSAYAPETVSTRPPRATMTTGRNSSSDKVG